MYVGIDEQYEKTGEANGKAIMECRLCGYRIENRLNVYDPMIKHLKEFHPEQVKTKTAKVTK